MSEYEKYLERAYEALDSAKILFENAKYNSSISQAYYAMLYAAKAAGLENVKIGNINLLW